MSKAVSEKVRSGFSPETASTKKQVSEKVRSGFSSETASTKKQVSEKVRSGFSPETSPIKKQVSEKAGSALAVKFAPVVPPVASVASLTPLAAPLNATSAKRQINRSTLILIGLGLAAILSIIAFMSVNLRGNLAFALELRAVRLAALAQVGIAIAVSTVLFQTVTANRILTPSIMGLDALYMFGQSALVFVLGGLGFAMLDPRLKFVGEVVLMMALALVLFLPLLRARIDLGLLLLTGVVLGVLFRSLSSLIARLIDPNDFAIVQVASFASFNDVNRELLLVGAVITLIGVVIAWRMRHVLDVIALGTDSAIGLGVDWRRTIVGLLILVAALVAVSTALVGPVAFFGLLVAALAESLVGTRRHYILLPASALIAIIILIGGQTIFQHLLQGAATLAVVVEFLGGIVFLIMLARTSRR